MSWQVRHEGSPQAVEGLTPEQVLEGLRDGHWGPTDEVKGPGDADWVHLEDHPQFAEAADELEPEPAAAHDDETHLDMTALIDVTMVLLIFFILTTSYAALQKRLEAPTASKDKPGVAVYTKEQVDQQMIKVTCKAEGGNPVLRVEDKEVALEGLGRELGRFGRSTSKTIVLLDHDNDVPHDTVVKIIDAAKGAGMSSVRLLVP